MSQKYIWIILSCLLTSCTVNKQLEGLWQIEKVKIGDEEMTPIAKWTRINSDNTQESGNGWNQHVIGNWEYDKASNKIELTNSNGIEDEYPGFTITEISGEKMLWSRQEDGQTVDVYLMKIDKLPAAPFNELLGVWQLQSNIETSAENSTSYLFLRWDRILIDEKETEDRKYGIYKTHGHKNELQIIYYETPLRSVTWNYNFKEDGTLVLEKEENGKSEKQEYKRINHIPK